MYDWIVAGTTYSLDDGTYFYLDGVRGTGLMPTRRLEERGPIQDGITDRGFRLDPRVIILSLYIKGNDYADTYDKREILYQAFRAHNTPGKLRFSYGNRTREIEAHYIGDSLGLTDNAADYLVKFASVALRCPDPTWYDPNGKSSLFTLGIGLDTLTVPMVVPITVGASSLDVNQNITYSGNARTYPRIRITGPVTDCVITHEQTGWKLDFTGTTIGTGEYYDIDLRYGYKTVVDDSGNNRISTLTSDSDLAEFCLLPAPEVGGGINTISVVGDAVNPSTAIAVTYFERYLGI